MASIYIYRYPCIKKYKYIYGCDSMQIHFQSKSKNIKSTIRTSKPIVLDIWQETPHADHGFLFQKACSPGQRAYTPYSPEMLESCSDALKHARPFVAHVLQRKVVHLQLTIDMWQSNMNGDIPFSLQMHWYIVKPVCIYIYIYIEIYIYIYICFLPLLKFALGCKVRTPIRTRRTSAKINQPLCCLIDWVLCV